MAIAYLLIGIGLGLLGLGIALGAFAQWRVPTLPLLLGCISAAAAAHTYSAARNLRHRWRWRRVGTHQSELAANLTPQLFGDYSPYIIEAAQQLGAARDMTAVPALLRALESCVDSQRPGWREVAEELANALAQIGDGRALPLLRQLENVRGIGFIPAVRNAIAAIEPHSSLLRPGSLDHGALLRPLQHSPEIEPAFLLRSAESE
jgi:hypothetical protein